MPSLGKTCGHKAGFHKGSKYLFNHFQPRHILPFQTWKSKTGKNEKITPFLKTLKECKTALTSQFNFGLPVLLSFCLFDFLTFSLTFFSSFDLGLLYTFCHFDFSSFQLCFLSSSPRNGCHNPILVDITYSSSSSSSSSSSYSSLSYSYELIIIVSIGDKMAWGAFLRQLQSFIPGRMGEMGTAKLWKDQHHRHHHRRPRRRHRRHHQPNHLRHHHYYPGFLAESFLPLADIPMPTERLYLLTEELLFKYMCVRNLILVMMMVLMIKMVMMWMMRTKIMLILITITTILRGKLLFIYRSGILMSQICQEMSVKNFSDKIVVKRRKS